MRKFILCLILNLYLYPVLSKHNLLFDLSPKDLKAGYSGIIREDEYVVHVTPSIRVITDRDVEICHYNIISSKGIPFQIHIKNRHNGLASLIATDKLNCEEVNEYHFNISAVSCDGNMSGSVPVQINVLDVNEYEPHFNKQVYDVTIEEGKIYKEIIKLQAYDKDCSFDYNSICNYIITNNHENQYPFVISNEGILSNNKLLNWNSGKNYILEVVAEDCGEKQSKPVLINIQIVKNCLNGWENIEEIHNYLPQNDVLPLAPDANLKICNSTCQVDHIMTTVTLGADGIGKNCDRGEALNVSVVERLRPCLDPSSLGAGAVVEDLLSALRPNRTGPGSLPPSVYFFDGSTDFAPVAGDDLSNAIDDDPFDQHPESDNDDGPIHHLGQRFSFSFWMRHESTAHSAKEHIYCRSDALAHNRHHLALFVKNCRLVLLVRQESARAPFYHHDPLATTDTPRPNHVSQRSARKRMFKPSEVRWRLPESCDAAWHHYAVNVDFPRRFSLVVDGKPFKANGPDREPNPEIVDDWPLHPVGPGAARAVVASAGACWEGKRSRMAHFFRGQLSDLVLIRHAVIPLAAAQCLVECRESLTVDNGEENRAGPSIQGDEVIFLAPGHESHNSSFYPSRVVTLRTRAGPRAAANLIRALGYVNTARPPIAGPRVVYVRTFLICGANSSDNTTSPSDDPLPTRRHVIEVAKLGLDLMVHEDTTGAPLVQSILIDPVNYTGAESTSIYVTGDGPRTKVLQLLRRPSIPAQRHTGPALHLGWETNVEYGANETLADEAIDVTVYRPKDDSTTTSGAIKIFERVTLRLVPPPSPPATDVYPPLIISKCVITSPPLSPDHGSQTVGATKFVLPANLISALGLEFEKGQQDPPPDNSTSGPGTRFGIVIRNPNLAAAYQNVLRQVHYFTTPAASDRSDGKPLLFQLVCHYQAGQAVPPSAPRLTNRLLVRLRTLARPEKKEVRARYVAHRTHSIQRIPAGAPQYEQQPSDTGPSQDSEGGAKRYPDIGALALVKGRASVAGEDGPTLKGGTRASSLWLFGIALLAMIALVGTLLIRGQGSRSKRTFKNGFRKGHIGPTMPLKLLNKAGTRIGNLVMGSHKKRDPNDCDGREEMAWDDGSLNIIVNPISQHGDGETPFEPISLQTSTSFSTASENDFRASAFGKKDMEITATTNTSGAGTHFATNITAVKGTTPYDSDSDFDDDIDEDEGDGGRAYLTDDDDDSSIASSQTDNRGDFSTRDNDFRWIRGNNSCPRKTGPIGQGSVPSPPPLTNDDTAHKNGKRYSAGFKHFLTRSVKRIIESRTGSGHPYALGESVPGLRPLHSKAYESCPGDDPLDCNPGYRDTTAAPGAKQKPNAGALEWDDSI